AHRARAAAASRARPLGLTFLVGFLAGLPLRFAHRAFCAAAILALATADRLCFRPGFLIEAADDGSPKTCPSSASKAAMFSLMATARRSCWSDRLAIELICMRVNI